MKQPGPVLRFVIVGLRICFHWLDNRQKWWLCSWLPGQYVRYAWHAVSFVVHLAEENSLDKDNCREGEDELTEKILQQQKSSEKAEGWIRFFSFMDKNNSPKLKQGQVFKHLNLNNCAKVNPHKHKCKQSYFTPLFLDQGMSWGRSNTYTNSDRQRK